MAAATKYALAAALADLLKAGEIEKIGGGRYTKYAWKAE